MSVTCKLWAGAGNQMFMISAVIGYAKKHGIDYFIPDKTIAPHVWPAIFTQFPKHPNKLERMFLYKEPEHSYNEIPYHESICIEGFFQSEKYFSPCREDIIDAFQIPYKRLDGFVSIHVRRGDYLRYADKHPVVTYEYISESVKYFIDLGYKSFIVCSDDIKWCRINLKPLELYGAVFTFSTTNDPIPDLSLMSCCEHNIIANSSFSWWSAWLNQNPEKIVIAPKIWFGKGNEHLSTKDILPESWIKL